MDECKEYAKIIEEKIADIDARMLEHKEKLTDIFKDGNDPKQDFIMSHFEETLNIWKIMVDIQRRMFNRIEQDTMRTSIEITGLPERYAKDIGGVAMTLSKLLHIRILESYVTGFKRIREPKSPGPEAQGEYPRTLVVNLISENIKKRILTVADSVVLSVLGSDLPINITEHLTPANSELLKKAREEALRQGIDHVWSEDGKIFVRRRNQSAIHEIKCDADLKQMAHY